MTHIDNNRFPWFTNELFQEILRAHEDSEAKVTDVVLSEAVAKGANYGSQMIRALVNYNVGSDLKHKSFVLKTGFSSDAMTKTMMDIFSREVAFYRDILPKFSKYQVKIDPNFKCAPMCYKVCEDPLFFVFEDLKNEEFYNLDRHDGLTFDATAMVVEKLAKLHAINAMLFQDDPKLFEPFMESFFSVDNGEVITQLTCGLRDCLQVCLKWPGYEHYSDKIKHFLDNVVTNIIASCNTDGDNTFTTLTHGNLWVNNIMYKFDETGKPIDVIMVDYQIGQYGSPAFDLTHLLYTSTVNEVGEREWDRLIQIYHAELTKSLELLEYRSRIPTLTELHIQILKRSSYGVIISFMLFRHIDSAEDANVEVMLGDSENALKIRYRLFEKAGVKERIQYLLDYFGRKGFF